MHECLTKLLYPDDDDGLEYLCQLLTTAGRELDSKQAEVS